MIVIALGGNALLRRQDRPSFSVQLRNAKNAIKSVLPLLKHPVVITHGNGPQVGNTMIQVEEAAGKAYPVPLHVAVAESQGEIGFVLEQALASAKKPVVTMLTQVIVNRNDRAFKHPSKPIGPFYSRNRALSLRKKGMTIKKVVGGYRRVVASPAPLKIVESDTIKRLAKSSVVIAAGGGGIPVYEFHGMLKGIDAVVDKDLASACLANSIKADTLLILTDVDCVYLNYGKRNVKAIKEMTVRQAKIFLEEGQFPPGSMGPKVQAAINFLERGGRSVIVTSSGKVAKALEGKSGTTIIK